jgi:hypothetical protein
MAWNRCLQHSCFKNLCKVAQASKNSDSNAQHFLSDLLTHSWFHSMLFALPGYQFPYAVMNRCLYLMKSGNNSTNWRKSVQLSAAVYITGITLNTYKLQRLKQMIPVLKGLLESAVDHEPLSISFQTYVRTLDIVFSVPYYLELHNATMIINYSIYLFCFVNKVKMVVWTL